MPGKRPATEETLSFIRMAAPLGALTLVASDRGLRTLYWEKDPGQAAKKLGAVPTENPRHPVLTAAKRQLAEYFAGKRREFDLPLDPKGTAFQRKAWKALTTIPHGRTLSYQEQAERVGGKNYARAVGSANRTNPLPIIVPCHRVIGKSGKLTGFLYGVETKEFLLALEGRRPVTPRSSQP